MLKPVMKCLAINSLDAADVNSPEHISLDRSIILNNPWLRSAYLEWYQHFKDAFEKSRHLALPAIELGAGPSFLDRVLPEVIKTDVVVHPNIQVTCSADALPYPEGGLSCIFVLNVLHHLSSPPGFFREADRVLCKGGRLVIIEPFNSRLTRFLFASLHKHEFFDASWHSWDNAPGTGRMTGANNALPWIILIKDQEKFRKMFPRLRIVRITPHPALKYLASGGLSYRPVLPRFLMPLVAIFERLGKMFPEWVCFQMVVEVEKTN